MKRRVLLKLSGEALAGEKHTGFDEPTVTKVAKQVKTLVDQGIEVGIVIGGGNFWRGRSSENIDRTKADQIGMLATVMNCIYVSEIFRSQGMMTAVLTPFPCGEFTKRIFQRPCKQIFPAQHGCILCRRYRPSIFLNRYGNRTSRDRDRGSTRFCLQKQ